MYTEDYEKPRIERYALLYTLSPAGSKLGHGVFPFTGRHIARSDKAKRHTMASTQAKARTLMLSR